jgi:hypothetical protein
MNADSLRVDVPPSSFDEWTIGWTPGEVVISRAASGSRVPRPQRIILDIRTGAMSLLELYDKPVTRWQIEEVCEG